MGEVGPARVPTVELETAGNSVVFPTLRGASKGWAKRHPLARQLSICALWRWMPRAPCTKPTICRFCRVSGTATSSTASQARCSKMSRFEAVAAGLSGAGNIPISNRSIQHAVEGSVLNVGLEGDSQHRNVRPCNARVRSLVRTQVTYASDIRPASSAGAYKVLTLAQKAKGQPS
jgi:hypothetical protein